MPRVVGKFGKLAPKEHPDTLKSIPTILASVAIPEPLKVYWEYLLKSWAMFLNDQLGCCVFACGGHLRQNWTAHTGTEASVTDAEILSGYEAVGGYDPSQNRPDGTNPTDNGAVITDFLSYWQKNIFAGGKIVGWGSLPSHDALKKSIAIFGGIDIGFQVPFSAMYQFQSADTWSVVANDGGIAGGHSVPILGYGDRGCACITWGKIQYMTWDFFQKYVDEAYAIITQDWLDRAQKTPIFGLDLKTLQLDLAALKQ